MDQELNKHLKKIEGELARIDKPKNELRRTLLRGIMYGAGYIIGAIIVIVIVGWILNVIGVIPALDRRIGPFRNALQSVGGTVK